jgi:hypothetical protein
MQVLLYSTATLVMLAFIVLIIFSSIESKHLHDEFMAISEPIMREIEQKRLHEMRKE